MPLPDFLIKRIPKHENIKRLRSLINDQQIHTVCEEAKCPNIGECFAKKTCTFLILGNICTRSCTFCGVNHGKPLAPDPEEPRRIAQAVRKLGLDYVVITSVTRDDLPDGGAKQFAQTIYELSMISSQLSIEILIPDFQGNEKSLRKVLESNPLVLNHNLETVPRLYPKVRPEANYERSLNILRKAKILKPNIFTKSGFMVGLGETKEEVIATLKDLRNANCDMVTIGQYLPPSKNHIKPTRFVSPKEYQEYKVFGESLGLRVFAGPFIRSSYIHGGRAK